MCGKNTTTITTTAAAAIAESQQQIMRWMRSVIISKAEQLDWIGGSSNSTRLNLTQHHNNNKYNTHTVGVSEKKDIKNKTNRTGKKWRNEPKKKHKITKRFYSISVERANV